MNYLPVKGFSGDSPLIIISGICFVAAVVLGIAFLFLTELFERRKRKSAARAFNGVAIGLSIVAVLALLIGGGASTYGLAGFGSLNERNDKALAQIEKTYDLKLSRPEFVALNYPQVKPSGDFAVYGSIRKDVRVDGPAFRSVKLSLVWSEGKFYLSESTNGEDFQPLGTKR